MHVSVSLFVQVLHKSQSLQFSPTIQQLIPQTASVGKYSSILGLVFSAHARLSTAATIQQWCAIRFPRNRRSRVLHFSSVSTAEGEEFESFSNTVNPSINNNFGIFSKEKQRPRVAFTVHRAQSHLSGG